jgi:5-methylcytosine-specific restriction endonuclease McrA
MMKTCIKCGAIIPAEMGSRCAAHPTRWRSGSTREWRKTRARILARDGHRCTAHVRPGQRCEATTLLEIHHLTGGNVLSVPDDELLTLCRRHHPRP